MELINSLPIGKRAINLLQRNRILTIKDLIKKTEKELRRIPQFGNKCFRLITEALAAKNLKLRKDDIFADDCVYKYKNRSFKSTKCGKCKKKAIYILRYCQPFVALCKDHCPQLSNGKTGYAKLTIIDKKPLEYGEQYVIYNELLKQPPKDRCFSCGKMIVDIKDFILQGIKNARFSSSFDRVGPAAPVLETEYWICKKGCY